MGTREIRQAAAVIAVRDTGRGPEILVIERSKESRFLPGYVSFPGGRTDDLDAELAGRWFGDAREAARASAVRELLEEVGLALTADGLRAGAHDELRAIDDAPPPAVRLTQIARWIAPEDVPVRFDARYFAVEGSGDAEPVPDGIEIARAWWAPPGELLDLWQAQEVKLYWPTYFTVLALAECGSAAELIALDIRTREPDDRELEYLHRSTFWQD